MGHLKIHCDNCGSDWIIYHRDDWKESLDVDTIEYTSDNIDYMDEHQLMTEAEVEEFRSYDYVSDMGLERKVEAV